MSARCARVTEDSEAGRLVLQCAGCDELRKWTGYPDAVAAGWRCDWTSTRRPRPWRCPACAPPVLPAPPGELEHVTAAAPPGFVAIVIAEPERALSYLESIVGTSSFLACAVAALSTVPIGRAHHKLKIQAFWRAFAVRHGLEAHLPGATKRARKRKPRAAPPGHDDCTLAKA